MKNKNLIVLSTCLFSACVFSARAFADAKDYFRINVVDAATGRGVPLVELTTTNALHFYTDSNGIVALNEPELMGQKVYFHVKSHGYQYAADMFGNRGLALDVAAGKSAEIKLPRLNIAERLYRVTGAGIYRDSVLVDAPVPIQHPLINGLVMGQDTVEVTPYRGKIYWFWGDTDRVAYPLGNFHTSGATSLLPSKGGLKPESGVDLTYWVDENGFSKQMIPIEPGMGGPIWIGGLFTMQDGAQERLITHYSELDKSGKTARHGLAMFNDEKAVFEPWKPYELNAPLFIDGHPFRARNEGKNFLYFPTTGTGSFPLARAGDAMQAIADAKNYQAFSCLQTGARYEKENTRLERDADGKLVYSWKTGTAPLSYDQERELVKAGKMQAGEALIQLRDVETGQEFHPHGGSTYWNSYLGRWVMLVSQSFGPSFLGELWFAEADTPVGPWTYARKIVTHDKYTFYNPTQHPFFDQDNGKTIYFEGTYTNTYSGNDEKTPRYNYNQMMYRLSLDDALLTLPAPVYRLNDQNNAAQYALRETIAATNQWQAIKEIPFFAVPPNRQGEGLVPIYQSAANNSLSLDKAGNAQPLFYALPAVAANGEKASSDVVPLYAYNNARTGATWYAVTALEDKDVTRSAQPLCRVWRNPSIVMTLDGTAVAVPEKVTK